MTIRKTKRTRREDFKYRYYDKIYSVQDSRPKSVTRWLQIVGGISIENGDSAEWILGKGGPAPFKAHESIYVHVMTANR